MEGKLDELEEISDFMCRGQQYFKQGNFALATEYYEAALRRAVNHYEDDDFEMCDLNRYLASALMMQGYYNKAEPHFYRSLEIAEKLSSLKSRRSFSLLTKSLGAIATFLMNQGLLDEAESYCLRCLYLAENNYGMDHYKLIEPLRAVSFLREKQKNLSDALKHLQRAFVVTANIRGFLDHKAQRIISDIIRIIKNSGDLRTAEIYALLNVENLYDYSIDSNDPAIADACCKLAKLYLESDKFSKAEIYLQKALVIQELKLEPNDVDLGETLYLLAIYCYRQGRIEPEIENYFTRSLKIFEAAYGNDSTQVAGVLRDLGVLYMDRGDADAAEDFLTLSLGMQRRLLGSYHDDLSFGLDILATIFFNQERFEEAFELWTKAEKIVKKSVGEGHPRHHQILIDLRDTREFLNQKAAANRKY